MLAALLAQPHRRGGAFWHKPLAQQPLTKKQHQELERRRKQNERARHEALKRNQEQSRDLRAEMEAIYDRLHGYAPLAEKAAAIVAPFAKHPQRAQDTHKPAEIDWQALVGQFNAIRALIALYSLMLDDEEAILAILLSEP